MTTNTWVGVVCGRKGVEQIQFMLSVASVLFFLAILLSPVGRAHAAPPDFVNETVIGSGINLPTFMEFLPDGRMLAGGFDGTIWVAQAGASTVDPTPFLTLTNMFGDDIIAGGERGLVGITLDPNFATNGYFYIFYTAQTPQRDRVSRFTAVGNTADPASEVVIWQGGAISDSTDHHGGGLAFGPDGKFYITTGDNGNPPSSQSLTSDHGKILRVNPDGTVPTDNPFFDGAGPNIDSIWAYGLRNPYRIHFDVPTGRLLIGDVGGNDPSVAKEEVNLGIRGAEYGWPNSEGACSAPCTSPLYFYPHNGRDASITGGLVYRASQFPSEYQGVYFYGDYAQNWIRYLTFDGNGNVTGSVNFEPTNGTLDGPYGDPVEFKVGPDGSLYYVDFGWDPVDNAATIRRIRYAAANLPPTVVAASIPTEGLPPLSVNFSSSGSFDPEGQPLSYLWTFGDGATSTQPNPVHVYTQTGLFNAQLSVSDGVTTVPSSIIPISVGNKPIASITGPANGATFVAGDTITFAGTASDIEDGALSPGAFSWTVLFHHDSHVHPFITSLTGTTSSSFIIPTSGHDFSGATSYEIILTVADSNGLQDTTSATVYPDKVNLLFDTSPTGLALTFDGVNKTAPFVIDALKGFVYTVGAPDQSGGGASYTFVSWSDGGTQTHVIATPSTAQNYLATFDVMPIANVQFDGAANAPDLSGQIGGSWSHTTGGSDRYLTVGLSGWDNTDSLAGVSVSYDGVAMTKLGGVQTTGGFNNAVIWGLANPAVGAHTVSVTNIPASFAELGGGSVSFTGVDQTVSTGTLVSEGYPASDASLNVTLSSGDIGVDVLYSGAGAQEPVIGSGGTKRVNRNLLCCGGAKWMMMGTEVGSGSVVMSWTDAGGSDFAHAAVALKKASIPSPPDTEPPSTPTNLSATSTSSSQINLSWTASTDNVGVVGYQIERCQGAGCTSFVHIATSTGISHSDTGLTASTTYRYQVRAVDGAGNLSGYAPVAEAVTQGLPPAGGAVTFNAAVNSPNLSNKTNGSWLHTISGSDRYLIVGLSGWDNNSSISNASVKYNGVTMTKLGGQQTSGRNQAVLWGLTNPASGANTVSVTGIPSSFAELGGGSISFIGVDQTAPTGTVTSYLDDDGGTTGASINTGLAQGDLGVDMLYAGACGGSNKPVAGGGQTTRVDTTTTGGVKYHIMSTEGGSGTVAMSWSCSGGNDDWAHAAVPLKKLP